MDNGQNPRVLQPARRLGGASLGVLLLALSACAPAGLASKALLVFTAASTASLIHTDKTIGDHAVTHYKKQDCALLHLEAGEPYCQDTFPPADEALAYHCYRSIAEITCYAEPNPTETASRLVPASR